MKTTSPTSLTVELNEPVILKDGIFSVSGNEVTATSLSADRRVVTLTLAREMREDDKYRLNISGVTDDAGNTEALRTAFSISRIRRYLF